MGEILLQIRFVAGSLPYKSRNLGIKISHGCREIAFCPVGYFNLSHPVELHLSGRFIDMLDFFKVFDK